MDSGNGQGKIGDSSTANLVSGMMKTIPPLDDLFNRTGLNWHFYLKGSADDNTENSYIESDKTEDKIEKD